MYKMKKLLLGALLTLATVNAVAQEESTKTGYYIGFGSTGTAVELDKGEGYDDEAAVGSLSLKFGYAINENIAIEGRYIGESDEDDIGWEEEVRLDSGQAIYLRLSLGYETFDPYILLGYAKLKATLTDNWWAHPITYKSEESGAAYGIGANWKINELISLTGDWTIPDSDVVQFNLGIDFKF